MMKIGITGSIASGKTTASKILSKKNGPLFNADKIVKKLYVKDKFKKLVAKRLKFKLKSNFKKELKKTLLLNDKNLKKLEKIIHPEVRKAMQFFVKKNKRAKILFFEIPLLVESKLYNYFDMIFLIKCKKSIRLKRYKFNGGNIKLFSFLNSQQLMDEKKAKFCDYIIVNNNSLSVLKKKLLNILKKYE